MKKIFALTLGVFLLTGCGAGATETLSCNFESTTGALTTKISYDIDHEEDDIKKVRITYDYNQTDTTNKQTDGVGTGTDGTTNDSNIDDDGIIDGVVGNTLNDIIGGMTAVILDVAGIRDRHNTAQNTYGTVNGFSVGSTTDADNNYKVTYVVDYDSISDNDLANLNLSRDLDSLRDNYVSQGFTCK